MKSSGRVVAILALFGLLIVVGEGWARNARDFVIASVGGQPPMPTPPEASQPQASPDRAPQQSAGVGFHTF